MNKADEQLMLIGATALLYASAGDEEQRQAAFDSILYAQLVANKHAGSRFGDYELWYAAYRKAFQPLGWIKLASTHDLKRLGKRAPGAQVQPLEAWLSMRSIDHDGVLAAVKAHLSRSAAGFGHLLKFAASDKAQASKRVIELGVLRPGPTLDLCSITLHTQRAVSEVPLEVLLREQVLQGDVEFNGVSLALDNSRFQRQRDELKTLMNAKDQQGKYRFDLGAATGGAPHE